MTTPPSHSYRRELFFNQVWQGLNFLSKAAFLAFLTPWMIRAWGPVGFALFALANSVLVSMAGLDAGIRGTTRLRLCAALQQRDPEAGHLGLWEGIAAFALVALPACAVAWALAAAGLWSRWLHLPPEGDVFLALTVTLVTIFLFSVFLTEPLSASGRISLLKAANTAGAVAAIPVLAGAVWLKATPLTATVLYFLCLLVPNIVLLSRSGAFSARFWAAARRLRWADTLATFRVGRWFYMTTFASVAKGHALTFLVSAVGGPGMAGTFYILLRITEVVGTLGIASADTTLAALAGEPSRSARAERFHHAYSYCLIFCLHGALGIGFLTPLVLSYWLPPDARLGLPPAIGWAMAAFGLATAFSRLVVCSAIPVGIYRRSAYGNLVEALLTFVLGWLLMRPFNLAGPFLASVPAVLVIVPAALALAENLGQTSRRTWIEPLWHLRWHLLGSAALLAAAVAAGPAVAVVSAVAAGAGVAASTLWALRRLHREEAVAAP